MRSSQNWTRAERVGCCRLRPAPVHAGLHSLRALRMRDPPVAASVALGFIHGAVGALDDIVELLAAAGLPARDADRHGEVELLALDEVRRFAREAQPQMLGALGGGEFVEPIEPQREL